MSKTPEGKVKESVKEILKARNVLYFMPASYGFGKSGVSDFVACHNGVFIAIEVKAGKGKTTILQDRFIDNVRAAGGHALVIREDNLKTLTTLIEGIDLHGRC